MGSEMVLGRWILDRARVTPDRVAIDFLDATTTYQELARQATGLSAELAGVGLTRGDRVSVLSSNRPEYAAVLFACALGGFVMTPLNWRLTAPELAYQLDNADVSLLIVEQDRFGQAEEAIGQADTNVPTRLIETPFSDGHHVTDVSNDDPLLLIYTSGTTGKPKGAVLTHANCFWTNIAIDRMMDVNTFDKVLQVLPQFHIGGWNVQPLLAFWKGATVILEPAFDAERALNLIESKRVTTMMGVPATYLFMAESPAFASTDLSSLRMAVVGGAPMPESMIGIWHDRGVALVQGYGLTEAAPNVLGLPPERVADKVGYAGKAYPHVEVALEASDGSGLIEGPGSGELLVRGPGVFAGYWRNPEETALAMRGGWLHTGDVAERDDEGFYKIKDRVKDMYISGGENVYPAEVEAVLHAHESIVEAAVVGIPDPKWGEAGLAVVVTREKDELTEQEVVAWCRERLAVYKVPRQVRFTDRLPRSGANKVLKRERKEAQGAVE
ncbi:MAG TPA: long-chain fatty acid--CoA ligase [Acidimicrobiia bacterium]|nr:long-chain fatty acid--CoA ligase [Acidimicrobiia bacterium]